jgi:hypothetical protein
MQGLVPVPVAFRLQLLAAKVQLPALALQRVGGDAADQHGGEQVEIVPGHEPAHGLKAGNEQPVENGEHQ